ncbi:DNA replication complex GINS protein SLD5-like [Styela clava]
MADDLNISDILAPNQSDAEEEQLTAAEVLKKLEQAWQNEKLAPDLLECKSEIVECVMELVAEMEGNLKQAKKGDIKVSIHRMELDRIRYVLSSYLRCRLKKIEIHGPVFLEREKTRSEDEPSRLSPEEFAFAKELSANIETHMKTVALNHMPRVMQNVELSTTVHAPNLDHYVFLKAIRKEDGVIVEEDADDQTSDRVDLDEGSQFLIRYKPIAELVQNGAVILL